MIKPIYYFYHKEGDFIEPVELLDLRPETSTLVKYDSEWYEESDIVLIPTRNDITYQNGEHILTGDMIEMKDSAGVSVIKDVTNIPNDLLKVIAKSKKIGNVNLKSNK